jgi:peptidoglycan/xylan/chitin deacetylase (PgdA/CDA1 family)
MNLRMDKLAAQGAIRVGMLNAAEKIESRMPNILRILAYHRIDFPEKEDGSLDPSLLNTTPAQFTKQMAFLKENYNLISVDELLHAIKTGGGLPPRAVMVTFDDGYRDFKKYAWPVLRGFQIPAVLFVATGFMNGSGHWFWWDALYNVFTHTQCSELKLPPFGHWMLRNEIERRQAGNAVKSIMMRMDHRQAMELLERVLEKLSVPSPRKDLLLNWDDLNDLKQGGLTIAAHTRTHPILSRVQSGEVREEVIGSIQDLRENLGEAPPIFAYPVGHQADLTKQLPELLQREGIQAAVTMLAGHNMIRRTHPLQLRRVGMAPHMSMKEFRLVLTGFYNLYGTWSGIRERKG